MWIDVYVSFFTSSSLMMMASSKLYPSHDMNATSTLRTEGQLLVGGGPVGDHLAFSTLSPTSTIGFWFWQVRSFNPMNFRIR